MLQDTPVNPSTAEQVAEDETVSIVGNVKVILSPTTKAVLGVIVTT